MGLATFFKTVAAEPRRYFFLAAAAGTVVVADQITKSVVRSAIPLHDSIPVIDRLFSLTYIRNPGAAFGLFAQQGDGWRTAFFSTISAVAVLFLFTLYSNTPREARLGRWAVSLVMGGALGNLIDRLRFGEVVDFLDFYIGRYHWPAFNVADSCISVGVALLMLHLIRHDRAGRPPGPSEPASAAHA